MTRPGVIRLEQPHDGCKWAVEELDGSLSLFKVRKHAEQYEFQQNCKFVAGRRPA
jgi:hypothetical protein